MSGRQAINPVKTELFEWRSLISDQLLYAGMTTQWTRWSKCHKNATLTKCDDGDFELLTPYRCELRICSHCAPRQRLRFYRHYRRLGYLIKLRGGNRFRFLTLTLSYDKLNPLNDLSERVDMILRQARVLFHELWGRSGWIKARTARLRDQGKGYRAARSQAKLDATRSCWSGAMGCVEINSITGFVHLHMLIYGWWVPVLRIQDKWQELTGDRGVYIQTVHGNTDIAIRDIVKYISKVPDQRSPAMAIAILRALQGKRRLFALGSFYRVLGSLQREPFLKYCPKCGGWLRRQEIHDGWLDWRNTYDQRHALRVFDDSS